MQVEITGEAAKIVQRLARALGRTDTQFLDNVVIGYVARRAAEGDDIFPEFVATEKGNLEGLELFDYLKTYYAFRKEDLRLKARADGRAEPQRSHERASPAEAAWEASRRPRALPDGCGCEIETAGTDKN